MYFLEQYTELQSEARLPRAVQKLPADSKLRWHINYKQALISRKENRNQHVSMYESVEDFLIWSHIGATKLFHFRAHVITNPRSLLNSKHLGKMHSDFTAVVCCSSCTTRRFMSHSISEQ